MLISFWNLVISSPLISIRWDGWMDTWLGLLLSWYLGGQHLAFLGQRPHNMFLNYPTVGKLCVQKAVSKGLLNGSMNCSHSVSRSIWIQQTLVLVILRGSETENSHQGRGRGRGSTTILFSFREEQSGVQRNQLVREIWSYFRAHKVPIQRLLWQFPEMQTHSTAPAHSLLWKHLQSPYPCTKAWQQYFFFTSKEEKSKFCYWETLLWVELCPLLKIVHWIFNF